MVLFPQGWVRARRPGAQQGASALHSPIFSLSTPRGFYTRNLYWTQIQRGPLMLEISQLSPRDTGHIGGGE